MVEHNSGNIFTLDVQSCGSSTPGFNDYNGIKQYILPGDPIEVYLAPLVTGILGCHTSNLELTTSYADGSKLDLVLGSPDKVEPNVANKGTI